MNPTYNRGGYEIKVEYIQPDLYNLSAVIDYGYTTFTESYVLDDSKRDDDSWHEQVEEALTDFVELLNEQDLEKETIDEGELATVKKLWARYHHNMSEIGSDDCLDFDDFINWVGRQIDKIPNA